VLAMDGWRVQNACCAGASQLYLSYAQQAFTANCSVVQVQVLIHYPGAGNKSCVQLSQWWQLPQNLNSLQLSVAASDPEMFMFTHGISDVKQAAADGLVHH
jgi:hypothetical protein